MSSVSTQNDRGEWVPAIPLPYYLAFGRRRCSCGVTRWGTRRYREHYALAHIIDGEPADKPPTLAEAAAELRRVNRRTPVGGYASPSTPVRNLPKAPTGPAPGARVPPNPGVASKAGAPRPEPTPVSLVHYDAGGDDTVACGRGVGFSTRDLHEVSCDDCAAIGRIIAYGTPPVGLCVTGYPARLIVPAGWVRTDDDPTTLMFVGAAVGVVIEWPSGKPVPEGWRWANGDLLRREDFPALAEAIGNMYASPHDDGMTYVRLPDFGPRPFQTGHIIRVSHP